MLRRYRTIVLSAAKKGVVRDSYGVIHPKALDYHGFTLERMRMMCFLIGRTTKFNDVSIKRKSEYKGYRVYLSGSISTGELGNVMRIVVIVCLTS